MPRYRELAEIFANNLEAVVDVLALPLLPADPLHGEAARLLREGSPPTTALRPMLEFYWKCRAG